MKYIRTFINHGSSRAVRNQLSDLITLRAFVLGGWLPREESAQSFCLFAARLLCKDLAFSMKFIKIPGLL